MVNMNRSFKRKRPDARRLVVPGLIIALSALLLLAFPSVSFAETSGTVSAWGWNAYGQCNVPAPNSDFVAVAAGYMYSLGIHSGAVAQPPTVTSITPKTGVKGWPVTITDLAGTHFQTGATVKLEQPSSSTVIDATNVNVESDTKITCKFTLSGPLGKYDVVVKNPDDQEVKLVNGFSVTNICGLGGGAIMLGFGLMMGLLSLAGSEILRKRQRRIKAG